MPLGSSKVSLSSSVSWIDFWNPVLSFPRNISEMLKQVKAVGMDSVVRISPFVGSSWHVDSSLSAKRAIVRLPSL